IRNVANIRFRIIILLPLAVFLIWEVVTRSLAASLAEGLPEKAIALRATEPTALLNLADTKLLSLYPEKTESAANVARPNPAAHPESNKNQDARDSAAKQLAPSPENQSQLRAEIESLAERALLNDPLNAHALQLLGLLASEGPDQRTHAFMEAAARRSLFETEAVHWLMVKNYEAHNFSEAIRYAIALINTRQYALPDVMPMLGRIAEDPSSFDNVKRTLLENPKLRRIFFSAIPTYISDPRTPLQFL